MFPYNILSHQNCPICRKNTPFLRQNSSVTSHNCLKCPGFCHRSPQVASTIERCSESPSHSILTAWSIRISPLDHYSPHQYIFGSIIHYNHQPEVLNTVRIKTPGFEKVEGAHGRLYKGICCGRCRSRGGGADAGEPGI